MKFATLIHLWAIGLFGLAHGSLARADQGGPERTWLKQTMARHCFDCHGADVQEGDLNLEDAWASVTDVEHYQTWANVIKMVKFGEMPPEDETQPSPVDRERLLKTLDGVLVASGGDSVLEDLDTDPSYANYVSHEALFSGEHEGPAFTPSRLWYRQSDYANQGTVNGPTLDNLLKLFNVRIATQVDGEMIQGKLSKEGAAKMKARGELIKQINALENEAEREEARKKIPPKIEPPYELRNYKQEYHAFAKAEGQPADAECADVLKSAYVEILRRPPTDDGELQASVKLLQEKAEKIGRRRALKVVLLALHLKPGVFYRLELGTGELLPDGRRKLSPMETYYALCHAMGVPPLQDIGEKPKIRPNKFGALPPLNQALLVAVYEDRLDTPGEIRDILDDYLGLRDKQTNKVSGYFYGDVNELNGPRQKTLNFIRGFFGYAEAVDNFKDNKPNRPDYLVKDADYFVEHVLDSDKDVLKQLLTADTYPFPHNKNFGIICNTRSWFKEHRGHYGLELKELLNGGANSRVVEIDLGTDSRGRERKKTDILITFDDRAGLLTHPVWNFAHSKNDETDPVIRGKWIREKLLAGTVRDVPIEVDAKVSNDHSLTLRERFEAKVNGDAYCWSCHRKMNPLGMPFENYNELGQFRTKDTLADKPIDATGYIDGTGEEGVDGEVADAIELAHRLAKSTRVRQSFVRHAFRYWMGRNEMLSDSPTLIAADKAYVESGGSMNALVLSLVTSDSFLYRK